MKDHCKKSKCKKHCKHCKRCKHCKHRHIDSRKISTCKLTAKNIKSDTLSSNKIKTKTLFVDDYKIPHPILQLRGYHKEPNLILAEDKFIPFPENGIYEHLVEFNHVLDNFITGVPDEFGGVSTFKDIYGLKINIDYTPTLKNNKDEDILLKCNMFIELTYVFTINTELIGKQIINAGHQRPPYINNTEIQFCLNSSETFKPYDDGLFLKNIVLPQGPSLEPKPYISFNEKVSLNGTVLKNGTTKLKFDGIINNPFLPKFVSSADFLNNICNVVGNAYDPETKTFGVIINGVFQIFKFSLLSSIRIDNIVMDLVLDNKDDAQFLEVLVGDTGPNNIDHNITITPVSYPESSN